MSENKLLDNSLMRFTIDGCDYAISYKDFVEKIQNDFKIMRGNLEPEISSPKTFRDEMAKEIYVAFIIKYVNNIEADLPTLVSEAFRCADVFIEHKNK